MNRLERRTVAVRLNLAEYLELDARSRQAGLSISNYIRTQLGLQVRQTSNPGTEERDREEDDAWERLQRLGLNPQDYFPA